jgi:uncharacterized protein with GYD domain
MLMIRVVSLVRLTDEGAQAIESFGDTVAKVRETVTENGGTLEHAWQTAGIYDFVAVLNFPDLEAEFRSRNEVYKMGTIRVDHVPAFRLRMRSDCTTLRRPTEPHRRGTGPAHWTATRRSDPRFWDDPSRRYPLGLLLARGRRLNHSLRPSSRSERPERVKWMSG